MKKYVADFETSTENWNKEKTWVWAWAICDIENIENIEYGNDIEEFLENCRNKKNTKIYFHNLKFDGSFIVDFLENIGFRCAECEEERGNNTYETLITNLGTWYSITVYFKYNKEKNIIHKVTFLDSMKILNFPVDNIAKAFNLPINKLKIDYDKPRKKKQYLTEEDKNYIKHDVQIVAYALHELFSEGLTKMTQGSNALYDYKNILGRQKFSHYFPNVDELFEEFKHSYKGGFTYLSPEYKEKDIENITVLDVNSLYPYVLYSRNLPYGKPVYFEGKYEEDKTYPLYIQFFSCTFQLKKNKIPSIQIKSKLYHFMPTEYLTSSKNDEGIDEPVVLALTNVDLKLFLDQYDVNIISWERGWKFKCIDTLFKEYIEKWTKRKIEAAKQGNKSMRQICKLMLTSLYGKFGTNPKKLNSIPYLSEEKIIKFRPQDEEKLKAKEEKEKDKQKGLYLPLASFVTAYAREITIRTAQSIMDYSINKYGKNAFVYADTDSAHTWLTIDELKNFCEIDDYELGKWAFEGFFEKARFIRAKCYIEGNKEEIKITCSGMPPRCYSQVNFENFRSGLTVGNKLIYKRVQGGVLLVKTDFTIKEEKLKKEIENYKIK